MSATDCPVCWRAEASWKDRLIKAALDRLDPPSPFQGIGAMLAAAMGVPGATWYERHRDAYAETGDPAELTRMLRHVA